MKSLNIVLDTNVFVAALLGSRAASSIYNAFKQRLFTLHISQELLRELEDVLSRSEFKISSTDREELISVLKLGAVISNVSIEVNDCRDSKDNIVLACALSLQSDCIVTGDKDLLVLNPYRHISIIPPAEFLKLLAQ